MRTGRKVALGVLILAALGLLAAMAAVVRPGAVAGNLPWWAGLSIGEAQATEQFAEEVEIGPDTRIIVRNDVGQVQVHGGTEPGLLRISGEKRVFGVTREAAEGRLAQIRVDVRQEPGRVVIEGRVAERVRVGTGSDRVDLVVEVPPEADVEVEASMGRVVLRDMTGNAVVDAAMGAVEVEGFRGDLDVDASMGQVTVRQAVIRDRLRLDAGMGRVLFDGSPGRTATIDAGMGSVEVRLPADLSLELDVSVGVGRLVTDLPLSERADGSFRGTIGSGEPQGRLSVHAGMGQVRIR